MPIDDFQRESLMERVLGGFSASRQLVGTLNGRRFFGNLDYFKWNGSDQADAFRRLRIGFCFEADPSVNICRPTRNAAMIRCGPGLVATPVENAVYCDTSETVSISF